MTVGQRPYHHGNLRAALLARAERDAARARRRRAVAARAGARGRRQPRAPRRHFPDKQALLDALAEDGFDRLGRELRAAIEARRRRLRRAPARLRARLRALRHPATPRCSS